MPGTPTTKYALPTIDPAVNFASTGPLDCINPAFETIDAALTKYNTGTLAAMAAAPHITGQTWLATDDTSGGASGTWYLDNGSAWLRVGYGGCPAYWRRSFDATSTGNSITPAFTAAGGDPLYLAANVTFLTSLTAPTTSVEIAIAGVYRLSWELDQNFGTVNQGGRGRGGMLVTSPLSATVSTMLLTGQDQEWASPGDGDFHAHTSGSTLVRLTAGNTVAFEAYADSPSSDAFTAIGHVAGEWVAP